ncbi:MAG: hypothetical protein ACFE9Y_10010 [Promethearchaeota archaeon]
MPIALSMEGWVDLYSIFILPFLILGFFESIIGLYLSIKENINKPIIGYIGLFYVLIGFVIMQFCSYYILTLIFSGVILIFLVYNEKFAS